MLCAGAGSRFAGGERKLRAQFRGRPLVTWAITAALEAALDETIVVAGAVDIEDLVPSEVTLLQNESWQQGAASSLRVALDWCHRRMYATAVVGLGDEPLVPASAWREVACADMTPLVFASYRGEQGFPVRLAAELWPIVPVSGDDVLGRLLGHDAATAVAVACEGERADVDALEDLRRWR